MAERLTIDRPTDWHLHLRDGAGMADVVGHSARVFARAVVMPNLSPPVVTVDQAAAYRERILSALPPGSDFEPLMALYLTDTTSRAEIRAAKGSGLVVAAKLYPAGATTHSDRGVTGVERIAHVLDEMEACGLPLLVHGEVTDPAVDLFDRERLFIDRVLVTLVKRWPGLRVVLEHVSTREGVQFVSASSLRVAATVTPQHLLLDVNDLLAGGVRPHHYCLPVLKRERDREALLAAAAGDDPRFFLGTDSAPHARRTKEASCGCAGIFSAHAAIELYAEAFEQAGRLERLEAFASERGADFYGLPRNPDRITLRRMPWTVPECYPYGGEELVPLRAGAQVHWTLVEP